MTVSYNGNYIVVDIPATDDVTDSYFILPDGYSYQTIFIAYVENIHGMAPNMVISSNSSVTFPPVNSKSPNIVYYTTIDTTKKASMRFAISKFGQIPDSHYFDKAFEPILVTGEDGKEHNVIPSDQFK